MLASEHIRVLVDAAVTRATRDLRVVGDYLTPPHDALMFSLARACRRRDYRRRSRQRIRGRGRAGNRATSKAPKPVVRGPYPCAAFQRLATFWTRDAARYKRTQASRLKMNA